MSFPFNVRVYGALIYENRILLSRESYQNLNFTKLPGGGLEFGEGLSECLKREFMEELDLEISVDEHIYTTDFFQQSAFNPKDQLLSIYYRVRSADSDFNLDAIEALETGKNVFWKALSELSTDDFTFPVDKYVVGILKEINLK